MPKPQAHVLLVTATKVESKAVLLAFEQAAGYKAQPQSINDRVYFDLGQVQGARVFLIQSEMGSGAPGASLQTVQKGIQALSPAAVIMVGIAFGVNDQEQAIGDILVTESLRLYELQRVGTQDDGRLQIILRGDRPHASSWLINHFRSAELLWEGTTVRFGCVLTGEKLVDNVDFRDQLRSFEPEAVGGEMEGAGLYVACQDEKVDWILVKAICDWADGKKDEDKAARQHTAAQNAAAYVLYVLQFVAPNWEERRLASGETGANVINTGPGTAATAGGVASGAQGFAVGSVGGDLVIHAPPVCKPAPQTTHSSLPPQPFFFGRSKELAVISDAIAPESRTWGVLIDGPGGIGKTSLAVRAGHEAPEAHFPRKIFLSAKVRELTSAGEQPLEDFMLPNYVALVTELARELNEPEVARIPENERANAVRRALTGQHALLVIDNLETFPELERLRLFQFLGRLPPGCKAIVTSRRRTDVDARIIRLDRLEQKDAMALLAEVAKSNRHLAVTTAQERQTLYEVAAGNPLLLRWTAGQLGRPGSQCYTVAEACAFLERAPRDNNPLEYIFGDLLDTFTQSESAVLAALTHFTQPARVKWIAEIAGLAERQAQTALEDLADRALLVTEPTSQTFLLPRLAAKFLRDKRPEAVMQTGDRLAKRAYALALEDVSQDSERFSLLDAEWPVIAAALPLLIRGDNRSLQKLCRELAKFLNFSGHWDERLLLSIQAEAAALAANDYQNAGWRAYHAGYTYYLRGQAADVLACAARAMAYWQGAEPRPGARAFAIRLRALGHKLQKDYAGAITAYREALVLWREVATESEDVAIGLNDLADVERLSQDRVAAERDYREALRIAEKVNYREGVAYITGNLAELALDSQNWLTAERLARNALTLAETVGRQEMIGNICRRLAEALVRQRRPTEGQPYAQRATEIFAKLRQNEKLETARTVLRECEQGV